MRINQITVTGLFGLFDHVIPFETDDRITIIHGPNGVGKTTVLLIIYYLFKNNFHILRTMNFNTIEVEFLSPGRKLIVERLTENQETHRNPLKFSLQEDNKTIKEDETYSNFDLPTFKRNVSLSIVEDVIDEVYRAGTELWRDRSTGNILDLEDIYNIYGHMFETIYGGAESNSIEWVNQLISSIPVHFIRTQRLNPIPIEIADKRKTLHRRRMLKSSNVVQEYSKYMQDEIMDAVARSGAIANSLDRTFPQRLLEEDSHSDISEKEIRRRYQDQEDYRKRLMSAGLIDGEEPILLPTKEIDNNSKRVLWHYLNDIEKKFKAYSEILDKLELFQEILNSRFLYKSFKVDIDSGFIFTAQNGNQVPLKNLSSGEQHEIVMTYQLIFLTSPQSLILIDEPEISLHVTWQHKFLDDMVRISKLANLDFLVATHSPSIVHNRTDLMIDLGGDR